LTHEGHEKNIRRLCQMGIGWYPTTATRQGTVDLHVNDMLGLWLVRLQIGINLRLVLSWVSSR
jgi:hypothetical protein